MLATLDYNSAITHQYHDLEKGKKRFDFHFGVARWVSNTLLPTLIKKLNGLLVSQLLSTKGALDDLSKYSETIKNRELSKPIFAINEWLQLSILFQSEIENIIKEDKENKYPQLVISESLLSEIIDNIYTILRVLQKSNLKTPRETSEMAKDLSRRSVKSLEKTLYVNKPA